MQRCGAHAEGMAIPRDRYAREALAQTADADLGLLTPSGTIGGPTPSSEEDTCHPPRRWTRAVGVRSPATLSSFRQGRSPRNKGLRYPADPPTVEEIIAVMRAAGDDADATRLRGLIVALWRAGLRIGEALALNESDLDRSRGAILVRHGMGGKRREVGMDRWAREQLNPWLQLRATLPVGALFCVLRGPTRGRPWAPAGVRSQLRAAAARAGVRRRFAPHQLRHAHAVEMSREGVPLLVIRASSATLTSRSRRCTCVESTTPRSSTPSTSAQRQWSRPR